MLSVEVWQSFSSWRKKGCLETKGAMMWTFQVWQSFGRQPHVYLANDQQDLVFHPAVVQHHERAQSQVQQWNKKPAQHRSARPVDSIDLQRAVDRIDPQTSRRHNRSAAALFTFWVWYLYQIYEHSYHREELREALNNTTKKRERITFPNKHANENEATIFSCHCVRMLSNCANSSTVRFSAPKNSQNEGSGAFTSLQLFHSSRVLRCFYGDSTIFTETVCFWRCPQDLAYLPQEVCTVCSWKTVHHTSSCPAAIRAKQKLFFVYDWKNKEISAGFHIKWREGDKFAQLHFLKHHSKKVRNWNLLSSKFTRTSSTWLCCFSDLAIELTDFYKPDTHISFSCILQLQRYDRGTIMDVSYVWGEMYAKRLVGRLPPIGTQQLRHRRQKIFDGRAKHYQHQMYFKFWFHLHQQLRLNVSLSDLIVSPVGSHIQRDRCTSASIDISSLYSGSSKIFDTQLRYCGVYGHLNAYPKSRKVTIEMRHGAFVIVMVNMSYSVMDAKRIFPNLHPEQNKALPWFTVFPCANMTLQMHHIRVEHFKKICLVRNQTGAEGILEVHDGPGIESKSTIVVSKFESSTFQVVTKLTSHSFKEVTVNFFSINGTSENRSIEVSTPNITQLPLDVCFGNTICSINLTTSPNHTIKVTLSNFQYDGDINRENCDYAGIAMYDHVREEKRHRHRSTECVREIYERQYYAGCTYWPKGKIPDSVEPYMFNIKSSRIRYPDANENMVFYSKGSCFLVVLYSYVEYGHLTLNISAEISTCSVMNFNQLDWKRLTFKFEPSTQCLHIQILNNKFGLYFRRPQRLLLAPRHQRELNKIYITGYLAGWSFNGIIWTNLCPAEIPMSTVSDTQCALKISIWCLILFWFLTTNLFFWQTKEPQKSCFLCCSDDTPTWVRKAKPGHTGHAGNLENFLSQNTLIFLHRRHIFPEQPFTLCFCRNAQFCHGWQPSWKVPLGMPSTGEGQTWKCVQAWLSPSQWHSQSITRKRCSWLQSVRIQMQNISQVFWSWTAIVFCGKVSL